MRANEMAGRCVCGKKLLDRDAWRCGACARADVARRANADIDGVQRYRRDGETERDFVARLGGEEGRVEAVPPLSERPLQLSVPKIPSGLIAARQRSMGYGKRQEIWERVRRSVRTSGLFAAIFLAPRRRKLPGVRLPAT